MAPPRPMLGELELPQVREIETEGKEVRARHEVPALEGDFLQDLGRRGTKLTLAGTLTGPESRERLQELREKFREAEPVSFVSDIADATRVGDVVIEDLAVRELAGKPERFEYALALREFTEPPEVTSEEPPEIDPPPPPDDPIDQQVGTLVVEVLVEGQPGFDMSRVAVSAAGTREDQTPIERTLTERDGNVWTEGGLPAGDYTVEALASSSAAVTASAAAAIQPGQQTQVSLTLRPGTIVARAFVIHFHFDKSFIEPCMRPVLRQVAARASQAGTSEKLLIVGHTDKTGPDLYNQSLSERRARSAHAFLTFGRDAASRTAALAEWNVLRLRRTPGQSTSVNDTWGAREYQFMLQDLGFYPGRIDGDHGPLTDDAVRAFRCKKGLPPGTTVDDPVWQALIEDYLSQDSLAVPEARLFFNARDGCDGGALEWLGCGELQPLPQPQPTRRSAWRPYRRVEFLFVDASAIPCDVKRPDTFSPPSSWCLDPGNSGQRCCFGTRTCSTAATGQWCIQPAEPGTLTAQGTLRNEDSTPFANKRFVLIAPDGQIKANESSGGEPQHGRTDGTGSFSFPNLPVGVYTLEVRENVLARLDSQGDAEIRGATVCQALRSASDRLDVVISSAPVLREIRLPVVAHLMTALHPVTREVRTCPDPVNPARRLPQRTRHTPADVRGFFQQVNDIWRQARVRFELVNLVEETYSFRTECEVDANEFGILLERCAYPNVVNVFFLGDIGGATTAGYYAIVQTGGARQIADGCAVSDRFLFAAFTPPLPVTLSVDQTVQVLAHKLGDFLGLEHVTVQDRLMLAATQDGTNRKLVDSEVTEARSSCNARLECQPLRLRVTGATQVGGTRSPEFIVIQAAAGVVTVDAVIPAALVAPGIGTLTIEGGNPGASPTQRTVSAAAGAPPVTEIEAVYTPAGGAAAPPSCVPPHVGTAPAAATPRLVARAVIRVATFSLRVVGARRLGPAGSTTFVATRDAGARITIIAQINPAPFCVPRNLVNWTNGNATPDPLRRTVSRADIAQTQVRATVAGITRTVTIRVIEVSLTTNVAPFGTAIVRAQIEGVLNSARTAFDIGDLFGGQAASVFRARADIPGVAGRTVRGTLTSSPLSGPRIERLPIALTRRAGDRFVSPPFLAIPSAIPRGDVTTGGGDDDLRIIRCEAGGPLRFEVDGDFAGLDVVTRPIRGRTIQISASAITGTGLSRASIRADITAAARVWAQAGIEIRTRGIDPALADPGGLLDLDGFDISPFTGVLTAEERTLLGSNRSTVNTDINVYYVRSIDNGVSGEGISSNDFPALTDPDDSGIILIAARITTDLAHELGHLLLQTGDEHSDAAGVARPAANLMHRFSVAGPRDLDSGQVVRAIRAGNPFVVIVG